MLSWLRLGILFLEIAKAIFDAIQKRNAEDAAAARVYLEGINGIDDRLAKARAAEDAARADARAGKLPDDPGFFRD